MDPTIPWYKSAIVRQQIVAFIVAGLGLLKITTDVDIDATVAAVLQWADTDGLAVIPRGGGSAPTS